MNPIYIIYLVGMIFSLGTAKLIYGDLKKQFSLVWKSSDLLKGCRKEEGVYVVGLA